MCAGGGGGRYIKRLVLSDFERILFVVGSKAQLLVHVNNNMQRLFSRLYYDEYFCRTFEQTSQDPVNKHYNKKSYYHFFL